MTGYSAANRRAFFDSLSEFVAAHPVRIDRPRGSAHPRYPAIIYPLDYGYIEGTTASDGAGVDVFVGASPTTGVVGVIFTVDVLKGDLEAKMLLGCTDQEVTAAHNYLARDLHLGCVLLLDEDRD